MQLPFLLSLLWKVSVADVLSALPSQPSQHQHHHQQQRHRNLLIGGENAPIHRFPYFVSLQHYCGGALIAPDIVLTAGHCKPDKHSRVRPAVGRYEWFHRDENHDDDDYPSSLKMNEVEEDQEDDPLEYMEIESAHRHFNWTKLGDDEFVHDFAILKLKHGSKKPFVKINRHARLPLAGQEVLVLGAGSTYSPFVVQKEKPRPKRHKDDDDQEDEDTRSSILQQVTLETVSNWDCERSHSIERNESYKGRIHASHLCTGYGINNERDSCDCDSGSPILLTSYDNDDDKTSNFFSFLSSPLHQQHEDLLVGLVSWGIACADPDFPGVNARVSDASEWIDEMVCRLSAHPPPDFSCQNNAATATSKSRIILFCGTYHYAIGFLTFLTILLHGLYRYGFFRYYYKRALRGCRHFCLSFFKKRHHRPVIFFGSPSSRIGNVEKEQEFMSPYPSLKTDDSSLLSSDAEDDSAASSSSASSYGSVTRGGTVEVP